ncbi:MAG: M3 family oligoendopeptidase [Actinomycetota bacterium]
MAEQATTEARATGAEDVAWDLTDLYAGPDDPRLAADVDGAIERASAFAARYRGRLTELSADELAAAMSELEGIEATVYRATVYTYLHYSTDTADPARGALLQRMQERSTMLQTELLFFELEWVGVPDAQAERLLADPALEQYRHHLASARRYRPHLLSEPEEKVMAEKNLAGTAAWSRLFTETTSALRPEIDGRPCSLEEALARLHQPDRAVRRAAADGVTKALTEHLHTLTFTFNTILLDKSVDDRLRRYPHWLASRNLSNEISDDAVQALVDAVVARSDIPQRYYRLKARLLGLDRLADFDRMAPIASSGGTLPWPEARDLVVESYDDFSPVAGGIVQGFFERRWIDAAVRPNKQPGAYCVTEVPGCHPYVMLSYTGERRSVLTLAHELGHGLHGALAAGRGFFNAQTPLTLAETASVFGEALTFRKLLAREQEPERRLDLLAGRLEDAIATVFRQIAMNRFEEAIHTARRAQGELAAETYAELWIETQRAMLGDAVDLTDGYRSWWSYIHHFVAAPGYVYAYAFGYLFSLAIYRRYEEEGSAMVDSYLDLLRAGGSDRPDVLASIVGLDLSDPGFWAGGLESLYALVREAEEAAASLAR